MDRDTVLLIYALLATIGALRVLKILAKGLKIFLNYALPDEPPDKNSKVQNSRKSAKIMIPKNEHEKEAP